MIKLVLLASLQRDVEGGIDFCRRKVLTLKEKIEQVAQVRAPASGPAAVVFQVLLARLLAVSYKMPWSASHSEGQPCADTLPGMHHAAEHSAAESNGRSCSRRPASQAWPGGALLGTPARVLVSPASWHWLAQLALSCEGCNQLVPQLTLAAAQLFPFSTSISD